MAICNPLLKNCTNVTDPTGYTNNVIQAVFSIFLIVGILYFAWHFVMAGYLFISGGNDEKKIASAKNQILYAFIGLFVVFAVFAILKFVGFILGIQNLEDLTLTWPTL